MGVLRKWRKKEEKRRKKKKNEKKKKERVEKKLTYDISLKIGVETLHFST